MQDNGFDFKTGHKMIFSTDPKFKDSGNAKVIYVDYPRLTKVTAPGKSIFIDDGTLRFQVIRIIDADKEFGDCVEVEALVNGTLLSKKGVNLPHTDVDLPAVRYFSAPFTNICV